MCLEIQDIQDALMQWPFSHFPEYYPNIIVTKGSAPVHMGVTLTYSLID